MLNLLIMIIAFGLMITIHELGHFLCARAFGVSIEKFSIGFGRPLVEFTRGETSYRIAWIPLGGYVKMSGENPDDEEPAKAECSFRAKAWWKRALIAFSGPFANLIFGFLLFVFAFILPQKQEDMRPVVFRAEGKWTNVFSPMDSLVAVNAKPIKGFQEFLLGMSTKEPNSVALVRNGANLKLQVPASEVDSLVKSLTPLVDTTIGEVFAGMPAWRGGIKTGDRVLEVDSVLVTDWYSMRERIIGSPRQQVLLKLERNGKILLRSITLEKNVAMGEQKMIGISQNLPVKSVTSYRPDKAVVYGFRSTVGFLVANSVGFYKLLKHPVQLQKSLGGPVLMASMSQQVAKRGFGSHLIFFASISLVIMTFNLLPIPMLDGGLILFAFLEGIFRRPIPLRVQGFLQRVGLALLLMLMIFAFYSDISKLLLRLFALRQ